MNPFLTRHIVIIPINKGVVPDAGTKAMRNFLTKMSIMAKAANVCIKPKRFPSETKIMRPSIVAPFSERPLATAKLLADFFVTDVRITHYLDSFGDTIDNAYYAIQNIMKVEFALAEPTIVIVTSASDAYHLAQYCAEFMSDIQIEVPKIGEGEDELYSISTTVSGKDAIKIIYF